MFKDLMDSEEASIGGIFSLAATGLIKLYEWMTFDDVNNVLQFALAIGGVVFLYHRIKGQILDNKIKRKNLKK
tara:strand:- start:840 stop:1058 length:219 start_codon:yes stop_codon:yes gene_type:complete